MTQTQPHNTGEQLAWTPSVSVVIPALDEADNLREVLPLLPTHYEIVLVDGNSSDDTVGVTLSLRPDAKVVLQERSGKGNALIAGFRAAQGDIIVMFDADGSSDPAEIDAFVAALREGADMAKGSRYLGGSDDITRWRSLGNRALLGLANRLLGTDYTDLCYGYIAFWREALMDWTSLPEPWGAVRRWGDGFEIEAMLISQFTRSGAPVVEVPSVERRRIHGHSNLHPIRDGLRVLRTLVREHLRRH